MFVEVVRFAIALALTAAGYAIGQRLQVSGRAGEIAPLVGLVIGCGVGYVFGGVAGRLLDKSFGVVEKKIERSEPGRIFAGSLGAVIGAALGGIISFPLFFFVSWFWAYPAVALCMWVLGSLGYRVASYKSEQLLGMAGLSSRPLVRASRLGGTSETDAFLLDTSALIDGRLLDVVKSGFLHGSLLVAPFVLEELQGIADSAEVSRRRRGKRGLEVLQVLSEMPRIDVHVLDDDVPEADFVDAKLVALAHHLRVSLVTTDGNLQRVAELQGIYVLNLNRLASALRPSQLPGDRIRLSVVRAGDQRGQGVGYLDDGTMVVIEHAADQVGSDLDVQVTSATQTAVGRMLFAVPDSEAHSFESPADDEAHDDEAHDDDDQGTPVATLPSRPIDSVDATRGGRGDTNRSNRGGGSSDSARRVK